LFSSSLFSSCHFLFALLKMLFSYIFSKNIFFLIGYFFLASDYKKAYFDKYINYCVPYYTGRNEKIRVYCIIKIPKVADKNGESCISILEKNATGFLISSGAYIPS